MAGNSSSVLNLQDIAGVDQQAVQMSERFNMWNNTHVEKKEEWLELRNYLFATDTTSTSNSSLPWANKTTMPKITQIRDNLHANYFDTVFSADDWMSWVANSKDDFTKNKATAITAYLKAKIEHGKALNVFEELLLDWIDTGNCFAMVEFVHDTEIGENEEEIVKYSGPAVKRISPYDIVFNPTAPTFEETPKFIRTLFTKGDLIKYINKHPQREDLMKAFDRLQEVRSTVAQMDNDIYKQRGFLADGFGSYQEYIDSDRIEILTMYGDYWDPEQNELHSNREVLIMDRSVILEDKPISTWTGKPNIFHCGWRIRPDNLWAMGPLDNLVGLQYRIDHLENLRADVFDLIALPALKIRGDVEDFVFEPGARIYVGDEGDVDYLSPDVAALSADNQIAILEQRMEEMAGAPKEAMGIRTPGEKTAFEVDSLMNAANRVFKHKSAYWERMFLEPILNAMLAVSQQYMSTNEEILLQNQLGINVFRLISRDDIMGTGSVTARGARHFAERAKQLQNVAQLHQIKMNDPSMAAHISGKEMAKMFAELLKTPELYKPNVALEEEAEQVEVMNDLEVEMTMNQEQKAAEGF